MTGPTAPQTVVREEALDDLFAAYEKACHEDSDRWRAEWRRRIEAAIRAESSAELVPIDVEQLARALTPDFYKQVGDDILAFPTDDITAEDVARLTAERLAAAYTQALAPADAAGSLCECGEPRGAGIHDAVRTWVNNPNALHAFRPADAAGGREEEG